MVLQQHKLPLKGNDAGWSSLVARWAHNPKVVGSNPAPATNLDSKENADLEEILGRRFSFVAVAVPILCLRIPLGAHSSKWDASFPAIIAEIPCRIFFPLLALNNRNGQAIQVPKKMESPLERRSR